jgi:hypothetical protein
MESASVTADGAPADPNAEHIEKGLKKDAIGFLDGLCVGLASTAPAIERATQAGVEATLALIPERPVDALLALAEEHDARAIVVGTYGEHPIKSAIVGSTPNKLLHLSERPVLVVPVPRGD